MFVPKHEGQCAGVAAPDLHASKLEHSEIHLELLETKVTSKDILIHDST